MQLTPEALAKIQSCKTSDELIAKAEELGLKLTPELAESFLADANGSDLDLDALDTVAGAGCTADSDDVKHFQYLNLARTIL